MTTETRTVFDGTLGLGGHAEAILKTFPNLDQYVGTDLDPQHLAFATARLEKFRGKLSLHQQNFADIDQLNVSEWERPTSFLLDLGICSNHVDDPEKGFSFQSDGPLKMSFAGENSAENLLNSAEEPELTKIFRDFGEVKDAKRVAQNIVSEREHGRIERTGQLRAIITSSVPGFRLKKSLTQVFQAIRIAVNDELRVVETAIEKICDQMQSGDRLGIITYHSLEDRIVKHRFNHLSSPKTAPDQYSLHSIVAEAEFLLQTKKPILPSSEELTKNPRSRSAKLRILTKR